MANTTISIPVGGTIDLSGSNGFISENHCKKESMLTPMPLYMTDSDGTDVFDFGGTLKTITLTGRYINESGVSALKSWADSVEALIQGHQDIDAGYPLTFNDDLRGELKVKVLDFETTWIEANPHTLEWVLKIVEASENA